MISDLQLQLTIAAVASLTVGYVYYTRRLKKDVEDPSSPIASKAEKGSLLNTANSREPGEWKPIEFTYPRFNSNDKLLADREPSPYRPFRWGKYNITMGIRSMPWEEWVEVDNQLPMYHAIRVDRIQKRGKKVVNTLPSRPGIPGGELAAKELVYELSEYLSRRYPDTYRVVRHKPRPGDFGWCGEGQIKEITIIPVHATYNLDEEDPMKVSGLLVEDDLALMLEGSDGRYYFQAGAIIVPGFWRMVDKLGLPLEEIHTNGAVPQYREKLQNSMTRFFTKLPVDKPVIRNNYFFQIVLPKDSPERLASIDPDELAWSTSTNGDEDFFESFTKSPTRDAQESGDAAMPVATETADRIRLRTERQSLRRLPRSGAVVFTIRTYIFNVVDLAEEPGVPGRMASAIRSWPEDVRMYKGERLYGSTILPFLDAKHAEQIEKGIIKEGDTEQKYPY